MKNSLAIMLVAAILCGCHSDKCSKNDQAGNHEVVIQESVQAGQYTYLRVIEGDEEKWLAAPAMEPAVGETYYYATSMEMVDFKSKELNRTFEKLYFVEKLSKEPIAEQEAAAAAHHGGAPGRPELGKIEVALPRAEGAVSIAELLKNKKTYQDKVVKVTGRVAKINKAIMDKDWIHLQDGTEHEGEYDLTITSGFMNCAVGDTITIEGIVELDKDFGFGYFYDLIIEKARLVEGL